jgi:hypothetical protein
VLVVDGEVRIEKRTVLGAGYLGINEFANGKRWTGMFSIV